jgi:hypothetical protein
MGMVLRAWCDSLRPPRHAGDDDLGGLPGHERGVPAGVEVHFRGVDEIHALLARLDGLGRELRVRRDLRHLRGERAAGIGVHAHLDGLSLAHGPQARLGDEGPHVEAVAKRHRQPGLSGTEQLAGLGKPVQDHPIGRRADLRLAGHRLRLLEDAARAIDLHPRLLRLPLPETVTDEAQALLARRERGLRAFEVGDGAVEVALVADLAFTDERLPVQLPLREIDGGPLLGHVRFGGRHLRGTAAGGEVPEPGLRRLDRLLVALHRDGRLGEVEPDQQVAGLDAIALADAHLYDPAADAGGEVDEGRLEASIEDERLVGVRRSAPGRAGDGHEGQDLDDLHDVLSLSPPRGRSRPGPTHRAPPFPSFPEPAAAFAGASTVMARSASSVPTARANSVCAFW